MLYYSDCVWNAEIYLTVIMWNQFQHRFSV